MDRQISYWFPLKRYGFGWGLPVCWQGWVTLLLWIATLTVGQFRAARHGAWAQAWVVIGLVAILFVILWLKGEKPLRWRWGDRD